MELIDEICNFICYYKKENLESEEIVQKCKDKIDFFYSEIMKEKLNNEYEENFYLILGYTHRLEDISQRVYYTFSEAIIAIDMERMMANVEGKKLNSIVYIMVLKNILDEYTSKEVNEEIKQKAIDTYKKMEEQKAKENKKYHMYQY